LISEDHFVHFANAHERKKKYKYKEDKDKDKDKDKVFGVEKFLKQQIRKKFKRSIMFDAWVAVMRPRYAARQKASMQNCQALTGGSQAASRD
jgi:hypothetical protein